MCLVVIRAAAAFHRSFFSFLSVNSQSFTLRASLANAHSRPTPDSRAAGEVYL